MLELILLSFLLTCFAAIPVVFDPREVSFEELAFFFWASHHASAGGKCQYRSALFYNSAEQLATATELQKAAGPHAQHTALEPVGSFYKAEDYHQKWFEKQG